MWTKRSGKGCSRASQPSSSNQSASWRAAGSIVRLSPKPIRTVPGSTIITSPPSSDAAVIIPRIAIPRPA
jgi:hypothetical protein